jgi:hypothetical protein
MRRHGTALAARLQRCAARRRCRRHHRSSGGYGRSIRGRHFLSNSLRKDGQSGPLGGGVNEAEDGGGETTWRLPTQWTGAFVRQGRNVMSDIPKSGLKRFKTRSSRVGGIRGAGGWKRGNFTQPKSAPFRTRHSTTDPP